MSTDWQKLVNIPDGLEFPQGVTGDSAEYEEYDERGNYGYGVLKPSGIEAIRCKKCNRVFAHRMIHVAEAGHDVPFVEEPHECWSHEGECRWGYECALTYNNPGNPWEIVWCYKCHNTALRNTDTHDVYPLVLAWDDKTGAYVVYPKEGSET